MTAFNGGKERWVALGDIPGIAVKDEIIIHRPDWGILVSRWLPLSKYPDLVAHRDLLSPLRPRRPVPEPGYYLRLMD